LNGAIKTQRSKLETDMTFVLARNWWSLVIRGIVAILVGVITFVWPGITLGALILLFGAYALLDGIFAIIGAWKAARAHERWGALVFEGIAGIGASAVTVVLPGITALVLVYVIAAWAVVTGSLEIMAAMRLRKYISGEWLLILSGVASILFGILAIVIPLVGALAIALGFGIYAIVFGALLVSLGFRLRSWTRTPHTGTSIPLPAH
jgi:uncharacterized membrane protein HdeD (DUF308 family)